jgi:hypothetical protein
MKKIGEGWQYSVYDLENGRVLKKFHSLFDSYRIIIKTTFPFNTDPVWAIPGYVKGMKRTAIESFKIIERLKVPMDIIGNPKFVRKLDFEQDKAIPFHDIFASASIEEAKSYIDRFIEFNKELLKLGLIDKSFNITKNFGVSNSGNVILIDIGELFDDPKQIENQLKTRAWTKHYVCDYIKDPIAREYFISEMDRCFGLHK